MKQFKVVSVCVLFLIFCSSANAWTRHKKPLEQEFNELLKKYPIAKKDYEKMNEHSQSWWASLRRFRKTKRVEEALDNNPELKRQYDNWRQINNLFVRMGNPQRRYEGALRRANEAIKDMINALNEVRDMEIQRQGFLSEKEALLESL